jgi:hypothetical protein
MPGGDWHGPHRIGGNVDTQQLVGLTTQKVAPPPHEYWTAIPVIVPPVEKIGQTPVTTHELPLPPPPPPVTWLPTSPLSNVYPGPSSFG